MSGRDGISRSDGGPSSNNSNQSDGQRPTISKVVMTEGGDGEGDSAWGVDDDDLDLGEEEDV